MSLLDSFSILFYSLITYLEASNATTQSEQEYWKHRISSAFEDWGHSLLAGLIALPVTIGIESTLGSVWGFRGWTPGIKAELAEKLIGLQGATAGSAASQAIAEASDLAASNVVDAVRYIK